MSTARRLGAVAGALQPRHAAAAAREERLLTDDQVRRFIAEGVLALPVTDLPQELHRLIHSKGEALNDGGENPGDGIFDAVPELSELLAAPSVGGALTSLLGEGWSMASHRHMHTNIPAGGADQSLHKDSQRTKPSLHRPRSLFIFYVPRGATAQMGATAVVPGSPYVSVDSQDWSVANESPANLGPGLYKTKLTAPLDQGTIVLAHHGIIHGATARLEDDKGHPWRPMFKFIFGRRIDPTAPSWDHQADVPLTPWEELTTEPSLIPGMESTWNWLCGAQPDGPVAADASGDDRDRWAATLGAEAAPGDEAARVGAAYQLGRAANQGDEAALAVLIHGLGSEVEGCRRASVHGLQAAGDCAVPELMRVLEETEDHEMLMNASDALGEAAASPSAAVVEALDRVLIKLDGLISSSATMRAWASGEAKREQHMLDADTAATAAVLALSHIGLRAVAAHDVALCESILAVLLPYMRVTGPLRDYPADSHYHGFNHSGVHSAAVLAAAALCPLPAMANTQLRTALEVESMGEVGDSSRPHTHKRLSNATHTAAAALKVRTGCSSAY